VDVSFEDARLRRTCSEVKRMVRQFGPERARKVALRLQALQAAATLEDLRNAPGRLHELTADRAGTLSLDLDGPYRLILRPTEQPPLSRSGGGLDWSQVRAVTVLSIEDPH